MRAKSTKKANDWHYKDSCYAIVNYEDNSGDIMSKAKSKGFKKVDFFTLSPGNFNMQYVSNPSYIIYIYINFEKEHVWKSHCLRDFV